MLTQEKLKEFLSYNPNTGVWRWNKTGQGRRLSLLAGRTNDNGYIIICILKTHHRAHRLAWLYMTGLWPENDIDHINRDRIDNRWSNLREATRSENLANSVPRKDNTSGYKGVSFYKSRNKWEAYINFEGKRIRLGYFGCKHEASRAYNKKAIELFGEFACLNAI